MDGLTFLRKIMSLRPMPVVMISTLTQAGAEVTLEALEIGAVDFIAKPVTDVASAMGELAADMQGKVKAAARSSARVRRPHQSMVRQPRPLLNRSTGKIVCIGASTGGVEALKEILMRLPADCPPILVTQHMPATFTPAFARRLDNECPMAVSEATNNARVEAGHAYIAPGGYHLELVRSGSHLACSVHDGPAVSGHRPSADVLFRSAARIAGTTSIGVILTGMGKDGAEGLLELRQAGAMTLGQDEASSLIYGMPRVAFERGAVIRQLPLSEIADAIIDACGAEGKPAIAV